MSKTLADINPNATVDHSFDHIDDGLLAPVMRIIATWSSIDTKLNGFVANLTRGDHFVVTRMVAAIENDGARQAAIDAAAKEALNEAEYNEYFLPVMEKLRDKRGDRNQYAHSIFASSPDVPNTLLLIDPRMWTMRSAHFREWQINWGKWYRAKEMADAVDAPTPSQSEYLPPSKYLGPEKIIARPINEIESHLDVARRMHNITSLLCTSVGRAPGRGYEFHPLRPLLRKELGLPPIETDPSAQTD